jgi:ketosteroid isomerase-like protein
MKLDDLGRRAAAEVKEASSRAHFSVRAPGSRRPLLARPAVALSAAAVVLAVGLPLLFVIRPWGREVLEPGTTTTSQATTTEAPTTTTAAPVKAPAATVEELVAATYAAVNAKDNDALRALSADDCRHTVYVVGGSIGHIAADIAHVDYDMSTDSIQGIEVLGEFLVSGDVVTVPVAYTYPEPDGVLTGFDVLVVRRVEEGLLIGGAGTFLADDRPDLVADPAEAQALIEASLAAFNADDIEGTLATMTGDALLWEDLTDGDSTYRGTAAVREFFTDNHFFTVEFTGDPVFSGRFVAVPSRNTVEATDAGYDGMYLFWIRDGEIALQAYAQAA